MHKNRLAANLAIVAVMAVLLVSLRTTWARTGGPLEQIDLFVHLRYDLLQNYVEQPDDQAMIEGAVRGMIESLNDPYTVYMNKEEFDDFNKHVSGSFSGIGAEVNYNPDEERLQIISPLEDSPAYNSGVMAGDIVLEVDGEDTHQMKVTEAVQKLTGPEGTDVTIKVLHPTGDEETITITRARIEVKTVRGFQRDADQHFRYWLDEGRKIGYVRLSQFNQDSAADLRAVLDTLVDQGMTALVFDLRFNPGGLLPAAKEISDMFLPAGQRIVSVGGRSVPEQVFESEQGVVVPEDLPVVVLANESSASASEIVTGALSENGRALFVGTRTFGKGSVQQLKELDNELGALKITNAYYYLPSGRNIHRRPINGDEGLTEVEKPALDDDGAPVLDDDGNPTTETVKIEKPWGVDPSEGQYVPMTVEEITEMIELRRNRDAVRDRNGDEATAITPSYVREELKDPQLAAAYEAVLGKLDTGDWPQVGQDNVEAILAASEIEGLKRARKRALEALDMIDEELAELGVVAPADEAMMPPETLGPGVEDAIEDATDQAVQDLEPEPAAP